METKACSIFHLPCIGDVVIPYWAPAAAGFVFRYEVIGFDGAYIVCKSLQSYGTPRELVAFEQGGIKGQCLYLPSEIEVDVMLSRDNKLSKLCN